MITSPENNVQLTDVQKKQLEVFQSRLSNLQNEIILATNNISVLKNDTLTVLKDKEYHTNILSEIKKDIEKANETLDTLTSQNGELIKTKNVIEQENEAKSCLYANKELELVSRENVFTAKETAHANKVEEFNKSSIKLSEDKLIVKNAKEAILKAIEKVNWK